MKFIKHVSASLGLFFLYSLLVNYIGFLSQPYYKYKIESFLFDAILWPFLMADRYIATVIQALFPSRESILTQQGHVYVALVYAGLIINILCGIAIGIIWNLTSKLKPKISYLLRGALIGYLLVPLFGALTYMYMIHNSCGANPYPNCDLGALAIVAIVAIAIPTFTLVGGAIGFWWGRKI